MAEYGATDKVRQQAAIQYIEPARRRGDRRVTIHSGMLNKLLVESNVLPANRLPLVCNALSSRKFQRDNCLALEKVDGPPSGRSSTVVYTYRLEPVPAQSKAAATPASAFLAARGALKKTYKQLGGGERFHRNQLQDWV
jgi:DNA polymerase III psi subunit